MTPVDIIDRVYRLNPGLPLEVIVSRMVADGIAEGLTQARWAIRALPPEANALQCVATIDALREAK